MPALRSASRPARFSPTSTRCSPARAATARAFLSVTIYLANMIDFDAMNAVYDEWVDKANPPARACVQAPLAGSEFNVEIAVIAAR